MSREEKEVCVDFITANSGDLARTERQVRVFLKELSVNGPTWEVRRRAEQMLLWVFRDSAHFCGVLYVRLETSYEDCSIGYDLSPRGSGRTWRTPVQAWQELGLGYNDT